jgi:hypothetical protein
MIVTFLLYAELLLRVLGDDIFSPLQGYTPFDGRLHNLAEQAGGDIVVAFPSSGMALFARGMIARQETCVSSGYRMEDIFLDLNVATDHTLISSMSE